VKESIEVFAREGGQNDPTNSVIENIVGLDKGLSAIDRDGMSPFYKALGKLISKGLESAVAGRDAASTENRDSHKNG
jgi:hypothetical protein